MSTARRVVLATFPDAQLLDVTGPLEVFATTTRLLGRAGAAPAYDVVAASVDGGRLVTSSGLEIVTRKLASLRGPIDTLLVGGGDGTAAALRDGRLVAWLRRRAGSTRRLGSVCSGAFALAEAGLLDGRRATTHWRSCAALAERHPRVEVDPDPIFVKHGHVYTSAGVCAGMDLALALVEEDHGRDVALSVARHLVLFLKRPGGQSQFSAQLASQLAERAPVRDLQAWLADHPAEDLSVEALARRVGMSPRNFARVFAREVGSTPARFVERVRVEAARRRLEESDAGVDCIAAECGFGSAETLRRAFLRCLRVAPAEYRRRFRGSAPAADALALRGVNASG